MKRYRVLFSILLLALLIILLVGFYLSVRLNIKNESISTNEKGIFNGYFYFYGLDILPYKNFLGIVPLKKLYFYDSGQIRAKIDYTLPELWNIETIYYKNGHIKRISYNFNDREEAYIINYYPDGSKKNEGGISNFTGGWPLHGSDFKYDKNGILNKEKYFIYDKESSKTEWLHWVHIHPQDKKYSSEFYSKSYQQFSPEIYYGKMFLRAFIIAAVIIIFGFIYRCKFLPFCKKPKYLYSVFRIILVLLCLFFAVWAAGNVKIRIFDKAISSIKNEINIAEKLPDIEIKDQYKVFKIIKLNAFIKNIFAGCLESSREFISFYDNGIIKNKIIEFPDSELGLLYFYYPNGMLDSVHGIIRLGNNFLKHGIEEKYSDDGTLIFRKYYVLNICGGEWQTYWLKKYPEDIRHAGQNFYDNNYFYTACFIFSIIAGIMLLFYRKSFFLKLLLGIKFMFTNSKKYFLILIIAIFIFTPVLYLYARFNIHKVPLGKHPAFWELDVDIENSYRYYYGLGIIKGKNWLGKVEYKAKCFYPSGKIKTEMFYNRNGYRCKKIFYYESGKIEAFEYSFIGGYFPYFPYFIRAYYENGLIEYESGWIQGGASDQNHGVIREYYKDGSLKTEQYFIKDKICSKGEWEAWVKEHPADEKYSRFIDYDQLYMYYFSGYIIAALIIILIIFIKSKNRIVRYSTIIMLIGGFIYIYYILQTPL